MKRKSGSGTLPWNTDRARLTCCQLTWFRSDTRDPIVYLRGDDLIYRLKNAKRSWWHGVETTLRYRSEQYSESENREAQRIDDYATVGIKAFSLPGDATPRSLARPGVDTILMIDTLTGATDGAD